MKEIMNITCFMLFIYLVHFVYLRQILGQLI